jgi:hypothetical protein
MLLYANGCSHIRGADIDQYAEDSPDKSFAGVVADRLGWEYANEAKSGGSNDRIVRTTLAFVEEHKRTRDTRNLFVMIAWTGPERMEVSSQGKTWDMRPTMWDIDHLWSRIPDAVKTHFRSFLALDDDAFYITRLLNDMLMMSAYLRANNVKFVFVNSFLPTETYMRANARLWNDLSQEFFYSGAEQGNFYEYLINHKYEKNRDWHFDAAAHAHYGELLTAHLCETYGYNTAA